LLGQLRDATQFGAHPNGHYSAFGRTFDDGCSAEEHTGALGQRGIGFGRLCAFDHGHRLTGQSSFVDAQVVGLDQPQVRWHDVPALLKDHVAWDQLIDSNLTLLPVATDPDAAFAHLSKRFHGTDRPPLGRKANEPIDQDDCHQSDAFGQFPDRKGQPSGRRKDQKHHALELIQKDLPPAASPSLAEPVGAELLPALVHLSLAEPLGGVDLKLGQHLIGWSTPRYVDRRPAWLVRIAMG
jgi:hypothetical protein